MEADGRGAVSARAVQQRRQQPANAVCARLPQQGAHALPVQQVHNRQPSCWVAVCSYGRWLQSTVMGGICFGPPNFALTEWSCVHCAPSLAKATWTCTCLLHVQAQTPIPLAERPF